MPDGSQSWKIIKTSAHSSGRIAQACDRCRSKKIKCDGKLPQCTQCINVGFECKTSDKLSRRAFPRGYTETLEQRVRTLEKELRDANLQLEAKTKQLTEVNTKGGEKGCNPRTSLKARLPSDSDDEIVIDDVYRLLSRSETLNGSFLGSSSGRPFFELFKRRLQIAKNVSVDFDEVLPFYKPSSTDGPAEESEVTGSKTTFALPSKECAEKLINSFFNTWQPLFPILHRPSFLWEFDAMYTEKGSKDPAHLAQIWLVLAIAARDAITKGNDVPEDHAKFFQRARYFLRQLPLKRSVQGLKALILAQLYAFAEEDYEQLLQYKTMAVGWAYNLGLHRSQKKMKLGPLTTEMRKRVFWSLYVVDAFSSAIVGLPRLLDDQQIDTEFPADLDDDFITEMGFLPTPPGNFSMMSAAIALFKVSKILARLLHQVYSPQRVSLATIQEIERELSDWRNGLPSYLRVELPNCLPTSTNFHSHAPMLLLVHHWVRTLVHRPILASTLLRKDEIIKATVSLAESSRAIITILSAMHEKKMPVSICLSSDFTLWSSCISLMEIALVYDKAGQIDEGGAKAIETALNILRDSETESNHDLHEKRISLLDTSFNAIPIRNPHIPTKIDTRSFFSQSSVSPATTVPTSWAQSMSSGVTSNPTFDFTFMRTGRLSNASTTESVASSFDPGSAWTPTGLTDRFSSSPEQETSKNDLLAHFLSTISNASDDQYSTGQAADNSTCFSLHGDSPTQPGMIMPTIFDWSNPSSFSDEEAETKSVFEASSDVSPHTYLPMFLSPYSADETSPVNKNFDYKQQEPVFGFKENRFNENDHIHTAPNLFSEESGWAV